MTNAHFKSLDLKMQRTQLSGHFDRLVTAHDFKIPKEDIRFWDELKKIEPFDRENTLLIDDSLSVLKSARQYGIKQVLAVLKPDTKSPERDVEDFQAIRHFRQIMPQ